MRGRCKAAIRKVAPDPGATGETTLVWLVFGPESTVGDAYSPGSRAGTHGGVCAGVDPGAGMGVNAMTGGGASPFALHPVSIQGETGISVAAAIQPPQLDYAAPIN